MRERTCTITKLIGQPTFAYGKYWRSVQYSCEGDLAYTKVACETFEDACELKVGDSI